MNQVLVIRPDGYKHSDCFNEIAEAFDEALPAGSKQLVFGAHLINYTLSPYFRARILYQTEQITPECWWNRESYIKLLQNHEVWDYSLSNIAALEKLGVKAKHVPIRYMPCMTKIKSNPVCDQDIEVLFYGSTNPRRVKILNSLTKAGIGVVRAFNVYGKERDDLIARSKIVLNLHQFDDGIFEIFRCAHLFANSKCVISEPGRDKDLDAAHSSSAIFHKADDIALACLHYLKDEGLRLRQEWLAFEAFKKTTLKESLK